MVVESLQPRLIICSTGTSIAGGPSRSLAPAAYREAIRARIEKERAAGDGGIQRISAETNSLTQMALSSRDAVALLHSDTEDGAICAELLAELIREHFRPTRVDVVLIRGLDAQDPQAFRQRGVPHLLARLRTLCENDAMERGLRPVINATGGFKSTVPYLTLFGMMQGIDVTYIHELAKSLITLPPAPLGFDYERLARAREALEALRQKECMPREDFLKMIPSLSWDQRPYFESLVEPLDGDVVIPSAFGAWLQDLLASSQASVHVHPDVLSTIKSLEGPKAQQIEQMLLRVADPLWRHSKRHRFSGTDLTVYKPGNTAERIACILRADKVYVCVAYADHDRYERELPGRRQADYDLRQFIPWRADDATQKVYLYDLDARADLNKASSDIRQLESELERLLEREQALELQVANLAAEKQDLAAQLTQVEANLAALQDSQSAEATVAPEPQPHLPSEQPPITERELPPDPPARRAQERPWWRRLLRLT